ncbi:MAG: hypothetical protein AAB900_00410, partial [Patescibacteria group bacterium]
MPKTLLSSLILGFLVLPAVSLAEPMPITVSLDAPSLIFSIIKPILTSARQVAPGIFLVEGRNLKETSLMLLPDQINAETIAPNWTVINQSDNFIRFKVAVPTSLQVGSYQLYAYPGPMPTVGNSSNKISLVIDQSLIPARLFCSGHPLGDLNL